MAAARDGSGVEVAFLHPDLGIGGAERLVVDAAVALQRQGYRVHMYTSHHEGDRCFKETCDGTLSVTVYGDWLPRHVCGRFHAAFAYLRMMYLAVAVLLVSSATILFCDQVSACTPVLRLFSRRKILFYCHFPDMLLTQRQSSLKRLYRAPLDWLEEWSTGLSHRIVVNSKFTAATYTRTFTSLTEEPGVLYPSLDFSAFDREVGGSAADLLPGVPVSAATVFLSINRFERKKNLKLALLAMSELKERLSGDAAAWANVHLVMAGGYDPRLPENVEYFQELSDFADEHGLADKVTFFRSFSDEQKIALLQRCACLLYTPSNEHFGICPLEAMYMRRAVIAVASGGPLETVKANPALADKPAGEAPTADQTGFLCSPDAAPYADAMAWVAANVAETQRLGENGRARVEANFSFDAFAAQLIQEVEGLRSSGKRKDT